MASASQLPEKIRNFLAENYDYIHEYCYLKGIATKFRSLGAISTVDLDDIQRNSKDANAKMYELLDRDPHLRKIQLFCDALRADNTNDSHQELVRRIEEKFGAGNLICT